MYWRILIEQRVPILLCVALTAFAAGILTLLKSPSYTSTVDIVVGKGESFFAPAEAGAVQPFTATMRDLLHSEIVAARVAARLDAGISPQEVLTSYSVSTNPSTALMHVTVTAASRSRAVRIAALLGEVFPNLVQERFQNGSRSVSPGSQPATVSAVVWNDGSFQSKQVPSPLLLNVVLGIFVGFILGVGIAIVRHRRVRDVVTEPQAQSASSSTGPLRDVVTEPQAQSAPSSTRTLRRVKRKGGNRPRR